MSDAKLFAAGSRQIVRSNLYWNGGKPIPTEPQDVLVPDQDARRCMADPRLGDTREGVTSPHWDAAKGQFASAETTIRGEFDRLVRQYAIPRAGSPAIEAADSSSMPADDILGNPAGTGQTSVVSRREAGRNGSEELEVRSRLRTALLELQTPNSTPDPPESNLRLDR